VSDQSNVARLREGFVDTEIVGQEQPQPKPQPKQQPQPQAAPLPGSALPPPEIEPSLVEQDAAAPVVQQKWPIVVKLLYRPLEIPGMPTIHELSFREPRASDINRYGNPCRVNSDGDVLIEERKMHWIMAALSGIQPPLLELLDPRDWNSCAYRLRHFFAPDPRSWVLETTNR
jgi:hypothetical protein